ncbi:MAG: PIN domain-containing protein [Acidobacteria bacterium]|nr:MAG: PIN domain-containing protein [Acidobacteriota bacterium]REK11114.1 MAG: PIN domain-containing protein [Acidobacteriota bacterium]
MIVVDASVVIEVLLVTEVGVAALDRLLDEDELVAAPALIDLEVLQVLRRFLRVGGLSAARARQASIDLQDLAMERYEHTWLVDRIWALRGNLTAYDAAYVALAEALGAPLLTRDRALARARHRAVVEVL